MREFFCQFFQKNYCIAYVTELFFGGNGGKIDHQKLHLLFLHS